MPDKPCTHCGGSGTEPDPVNEAYKALLAVIDGWDAPPMHHNAGLDLRNAAFQLRSAAGDEREQHEARVVFLEAALRDILSRFGEPLRGAMQIWRADNEDIRNWQAILDNTPGIVSADGQVRHVSNGDGAYIRSQDARA